MHILKKLTRFTHHIRFPKALKKVLNGKVFLILAALCLIGFGIGAYFFVLKDIPSAAKIAQNNYPQSTKIYDRDGNLLYTIYSTRNQSFVELSRIPKVIQQATIATEDKDFYKSILLNHI